MKTNYLLYREFYFYIPVSEKVTRINLILKQVEYRKQLLKTKTPHVTCSLFLFSMSYIFLTKSLTFLLVSKNLNINNPFFSK